MFNKNGEEVFHKSLFNNIKPKTKTIQGHTLPTQTFYKSVVLDTLGNIYIVGSSFSKNHSRDVFVFDKAGSLLTTVLLPHSTHLIHIDRHNFLYSRAEMGTILKKYKLIYHRNKP